MNTQVITKVVGRGLLLLQKHAPDILVATGIGGIIVGGVLASRATLELKNNIAPHKKLILDHKLYRAETPEDEYPTESFQRDMVIGYTRMTKSIIQTYAIPVAIGAAGIGCILWAHGILKGRNAALMVAYNALDAAFKQYRKKTQEVVGENREAEIYHGVEDTEIETVNENGEVEKRVVKAVAKDKYSQYARFFDETNVNWEPNHPEMNLFFLRAAQSYANDQLRSRGHVFLNEIYDALGIPRSAGGAIVGWVLSSDGDNYIDFGIYDSSNQERRAFVNGTEPAILLDFNVDGVIFDKI